MPRQQRHILNSDGPRIRPSLDRIQNSSPYGTAQTIWIIHTTGKRPQWRTFILVKTKAWKVLAEVMPYARAGGLLCSRMLANVRLQINSLIVPHT